MISYFAAIVAIAVLCVGIGFQLLLALGAPWGRAAWGGKHTGALPMNLRLGSLAASAVLGVAAWIVLARAGVMVPQTQSTAVRIATWVFGGFFCLNTLGNLASKSSLERMVMTPQTVILAVCFLVVAWS